MTKSNEIASTTKINHSDAYPVSQLDPSNPTSKIGPSLTITTQPPNPLNQVKELISGREGPRKLTKAEIEQHRKVGAIVLHALRSQTPREVQLVALRENKRIMDCRRRSRIWFSRTCVMSTLVEVSCESMSVD